MPGFVLAAKRRQRQLAAAAIGSSILVASLLVGYELTHERALRAELARGVGDARRCLIGEPLAPGESPEQRIRILQLEAFNAPGSDGLLDTRWPHRCAPPLRALIDLARRSAQVDPARPFAALADVLEKREAALDDLTPQIHDAFAAFDRIEPEPAPGQAHARPLSIDDLGPDSRIGSSFGERERIPGPRTRATFLGALCDFDAAQPVVVCRKVAQSNLDLVRHRPLAGTAESAAAFAWFGGSDRTMVHGDHGDMFDAVRHSESRAVVDTLLARGGVAHADGSLTVLGFTNPSSPLALVHGDGVQTRPIVVPTPPGRAIYDAQILWEDLLVRGHGDDGRDAVLALSLQDALRGSKVYRQVLPDVDSGTQHLHDAESDISACRAQRVRAVLVHGHIAFRRDDGSYEPVANAAEGELRCHDDVATIVSLSGWVTGSLERWIAHTTCAPAIGCRTQEASVESLNRNRIAVEPFVRDLKVADFDGKLLAVWRSGLRSGLRLRLATTKAFDAAPDVVVLDEHQRGGERVLEPTLTAFDLITGPGVAALLVQSDDDVHVLRIEHDGSVKPWPVRFTAP